MNVRKILIQFSGGLYSSRWLIYTYQIQTYEQVRESTNGSWKVCLHATGPRSSSPCFLYYSCHWKSQPTSRAPVREIDVACVLSLFNTILLGQQVKVTHFEVLQETTWQLAAASGVIDLHSKYNFFWGGGGIFPFDLPTQLFCRKKSEPNHLKMAPLSYSWDTQTYSPFTAILAEDSQGIVDEAREERKPSLPTAHVTRFRYVYVLICRTKLWDGFRMLECSVLTGAALGALLLWSTKLVHVMSCGPITRELRSRDLTVELLLSETRFWGTISGLPHVPI